MLSLVFISLLTTTTSCRSVKKTTVIRVVDTVIIIKEVEIKAIEPVTDTNVYNNDTAILFSTPEADVILYTTDRDTAVLRALKTKAVIDIKIKEKKAVIKVKEVIKKVEKKNDNPIKQFFFIFGILSLVVIVLFLVIKFII